MARSSLLPISSLGLIHIHENEILFCLSWLKAQFAKVFSEHSHQIYPTLQQDLCTECLCNVLPIRLYMHVCNFFPSLWPKLFCTKQNSFDRAEQESNGARHLWERVLAPLGAVANPIPLSYPLGRQPELGPLFERRALDAHPGRKFCMWQGGRCQHRTEWGG